MPLLMDLVAAFTVRKMPAKPGPGSLEMEMETGYPKAIGDASVLTLRRTESAYMRSSK